MPKMTLKLWNSKTLEAEPIHLDQWRCYCAFENLAKAASNLVLKQPQNPHALVLGRHCLLRLMLALRNFSAENWQTCKQSFEKAIEIDGDALNGSAYTSLGVLYYKVPGWLLSFGSDKSPEISAKGLELNPDGIDWIISVCWFSLWGSPMSIRKAKTAFN